MGLRSPRSPHSPGYGQGYRSHAYSLDLPGGKERRRGDSPRGHSGSRQLPPLIQNPNSACNWTRYVANGTGMKLTNSLDSRLRGFKRIRPSVVKPPKLEPDFHPCSVATTCYGHTALRTLSESDRCRDQLLALFPRRMEATPQTSCRMLPPSRGRVGPTKPVSQGTGKRTNSWGAKKPAPGFDFSSLATVSFEFGPEEQGEACQSSGSCRSLGPRLRAIRSPGAESGWEPPRWTTRTGLAESPVSRVVRAWRGGG